MPIPDSDPLVVAPSPTPFQEDDSVDYDAIAFNVQRWLTTPLSGFVLCTANGEENALSENEKVEIVRTVSAARGAERMVIAGIDLPSTIESVRMAEHYAMVGADMVRVRIPRGLEASGVVSYFREITSRSPIPVIVIHQTFQNTPAAPPEIIGEVCGMDNVFGYITDHDIRFEGWVRLRFPSERRFWICNGGLLAYGALLGATGACMWLGNIAPQLCTDIMAAGIEGDYRTARWHQGRATTLDWEIGRYGLPGVKTALAILGYQMTGPRPPAIDAPEQVRANIEATLRKTRILE